MKRFLSIVIALLVFGPAAQCICESGSSEVTLCVMDAPENCCCSTDVQSVPIRHIPEFITPPTFQPAEPGQAVLPASPALTHLEPIQRFSADLPTATSKHLPSCLYLTHQSFLI